MFVRADDGRRRLIELATAVNISAGGALIATKRDLSPAEWVEIEIPHGPIADKSVLAKSITTLRARLVRRTPCHRCFLLGLKWEEPLISAQPKSVRTMRTRNLTVLRPRAVNA